MKVGDLVVLSSYGKARNYNIRLTARDPSQTGLIIEVKPNSAYPYRIRWSKTEPLGWTQATHSRTELKYAYR